MTERTMFDLHRLALDNHTSLHIPQEWQRFNPASLKGTVMIIGKSDTGKTTLARYLFHQLCRHCGRVGFLDCDVGQSTLGLPTTMTLMLATPAEEPNFPPRGEAFSYFIGSNSPRGHMLPTVVGARKLQMKAQEIGAEAIVVDTTGLVDRAAGGGALKHWKIELLQPSTLVSLARGSELEHILWPWRRDRRVRVHELRVSKHVQERDRETRICYREERFRNYFGKAKALKASIRNTVIFGIEEMSQGRVLALQDEAGFALALGVAQEYERNSQTLAICTPLTSMEGVSSIRFGTLRLDPATGQEL
jgi:polynucleotide 5'-hydroxyl-kinase GRC3/NOL9